MVEVSELLVEATVFTLVVSFVSTVVVVSSAVIVICCSVFVVA